MNSSLSPRFTSDIQGEVISVYKYVTDGLHSTILPVFTNKVRAVDYSWSEVCNQHCIRIDGIADVSYKLFYDNLYQIAFVNGLPMIG